MKWVKGTTAFSKGQKTTEGHEGNDQLCRVKIYNTEVIM